MGKALNTILAVSLPLTAWYSIEQRDSEPATALATATADDARIAAMDPVLLPIDKAPCDGMHFSDSSSIIPLGEYQDYELLKLYAGGGADSEVTIADLNEAEIPREAIKDPATRVIGQYIIDKNAADVSLYWANGGPDGLTEDSDTKQAEEFAEFIECDALQVNAAIAIELGQSATAEYWADGGPDGFTEFPDIMKANTIASHLTNFELLRRASDSIDQGAAETARYWLSGVFDGDVSESDKENAQTYINLITDEDLKAQLTQEALSA